MGRPPRIRRDQILDTARGVFAAKGFAATTLADIAGQLHVTPAALLRQKSIKTVLLANKADGVKADVSLGDFARLGLGTPIGVSAKTRLATSLGRRPMATRPSMATCPPTS